MRDELIGKRARCKACGKALLLVPVVEEESRSSDAPSPLSRPARREWSRRYLLLALALLPLIVSFLHSGDEPMARLKRTIDGAPEEVSQKVDRAMKSREATLDDVIDLLPGGKIEGALVARKTWAHWGLAGVSVLGFGAVIVLLFGADRRTVTSLALVALFTGTIGIAFLLLVQLIAGWSQGAWIRGGGKAAILFLIVKFIGFSYRAALDPENGFVASLFGFTLGVGLCEELVKALPIVHHFRNKATLDWRGACLWGLASGIGFGVSEGITYSSDYYNGISGAEIYVVRFVSCVALHAFWTAAVAIVLYERQQSIQGQAEWYEWLLPVLAILAVPMVLHGLYDTLLKRNMGVLALVVAVASFGWLAWQIEKQRRLERGSGSVSA